MIFVTLGTDHHPFNRLVGWLSKGLDSGIITEKIVIQHGYTEVDDTRIIRHKMIGFDQMIRNFQEADLVVTHGSSTAMLICHVGIKPLVVPRMAKFGEHIDDHQLEFVNSTRDIYPFSLALTEEDFFSAIKNKDAITQWSDDFEIGGKDAILKLKNEFEKLIVN